MIENILKNNFYLENSQNVVLKFIVKYSYINLLLVKSMRILNKLYCRRHCYLCVIQLKQNSKAMYKKIIEASIEMGDPPIHFLIFYEPPFLPARKYVTPPLFPPPPHPPPLLNYDQSLRKAF